MDKVEKNSLELVEPLDDSSEEEIFRVKQCLKDAGFSTEEQEWIVEVFRHPDCFGDPTGASVFRDRHDNYEHGDFGDALSSSLAWTEIINTGKNKNTILTLLFSLMLNFGPRYNTELSPNVPLNKADSPSDRPQWVREFQKHAKFSDKSLDWEILIEIYNGTYNTSFDLYSLLPFLFPSGVPLNNIVNLDLLNPVFRRGWSSNDFNDPRQLEFWLIWRFKANDELQEIIKLDTLLPDFSGFSEDVLGDKMLGFINSIDYAINMASSMARFNPYTDGWRYVAQELIPFMELLTDKHPESIQERSSLLKAWWHLSRYIYSWSFGELETELPDDLKKRLIDSASRHIGILRSVLRDTPEEFENEDVRDFYDKAFYVLLSFALPWKRLKPLLLAFSGMTKQAVAKDLRTWKELDSTDNPPPIYSRVANWIEVAMYSQNLRSEIQEDPHLRNLREEFAKFCLERLQTNSKHKDVDYVNEDFKEPRPEWRRCYVQALKALRVNPGGRAHRTLFWLYNNDPDETVRDLAKKAHKQVRHLDRNKPNLDVGASPRRPLFEAFWWLRQAHLITLGIEIDHAGAMRTRRRELHRTREKDDR